MKIRNLFSPKHIIGQRLLFSDDMKFKQVTVEMPLRSALFSAEQMKQHGRVLAGFHSFGIEKIREQKLLLRLKKNEELLIDVRSMLVKAIQVNRRITPAGEWLLDNFYLIEEQIRTARRHLPKGYSRELPRLKNSHSIGLPRVYDIALEVISHGDGCVDAENLISFVSAYQSVSFLQLGELWAIPIMLRLALIENIRRVVSRIASDMTEQNRAAYWADRMIETAKLDHKNLILVIAEMVHSDPPMVSSFVAEFTRHLEGKGNNLALPLTWIEQQLFESGLTIKQLVVSEIQQQAADQVSMSNSIGSLRLLGSIDWHEFVETISIVNQILAQDPSGYYNRMDFTTRDLYRHVIEKAAKNSSLSEDQIARIAIKLANESSKNPENSRFAHVGYYLIDKGFTDFKKSAMIKTMLWQTVKNIFHRIPFLIYSGSIIFLTSLITISMLLVSYKNSFLDWHIVAFGLLLFLSISQLSYALINWFATLLATPKPLPRLDYTHGIPPESKTMTVIPTMLTNKHSIENLVEALEVRFLANQDANLFFALLTDFLDADQENMPDDVYLIEVATKKIQELNQKYSELHGEKFFLFHRPRLWNPKEKTWMGFERKRGKLGDLNAYLRGGSPERFSVIIGNITEITDVKYIITLDTDTHLPRDSARQFAGAMSHPLNKPFYDESKSRVTEGYGILQPRVTIILQNTNQSKYAQLCGSEAGIDTYTRAVSDVYQDLFKEGSFVGKGIYDIDAFEQSIKGKFPHNLILSHDLLEGCYARSGLLSDVQLIEEYPSRYSADVNRRRRWIRGDWQLVRWLFPFISGSDGKMGKNPLSLLSKWKLLDNLRRSLVPIALTIVLILDWLVFSDSGFWTLVVIGIICIPYFLISFVDAFKKAKNVLWTQHLSAVIGSAGKRLAESVYSLACMPYEAYYCLNAIICSLWRTLISKKHLLEWNTAADSKRNNRTGLVGSYINMWIAPFTAIAVLSALIIYRPVVIILAAPILALWIFSPLVAWWISLPFRAKIVELSESQTDFLFKLSRKTWSFFQTFVGPDDNWLPPDNFQEQPVTVIAHRTSPTNMGLALLANLSAYDFGYSTAGNCLERTENALNSMNKLERYRGHFFNWYDTQSLRWLPPNYISTVDSGNLAAYLLILRTGLLQIPDEKIINPRFFCGILDTFKVLKESLGNIKPPKFSELEQDITAACRNQPTSISSVKMFLERFVASAIILADFLKDESDSQIKWWSQALAQQCRVTLDELIIFAPWAGDNNKQQMQPEFDEVPTLKQIVKWNIKFQPENIDENLKQLLQEASNHALDRIKTIERLAHFAGEMAKMEYEFLYNKDCHLLAIGYNVNERRRDLSYYDLLASEARLGSFVAIAQGQIPQENWFALGRQLTTAGGNPVLLSWSGTMFEYLMPLIVMPAYDNSLLDQTCKATVLRQIEYGKQCGIPWGISESGYQLIDASLNYQYQAFGVPGLGLKRGLADDLVIAPYASVMAMMVVPEAACENLERLTDDGFMGKYGFYEAIDYTVSRLAHGETKAVVKSFMVHHQGMSLLALAYFLLDQPMQKRFNAEPQFQATALLLQERIPKAMVFYSRTDELPEVHANTSAPDMPVRIFSNPDSQVPEVQLLSNGRYHVMITNSGGGYSRWNDFAVTRWREDGTMDNWGSFCYIQDATSGQFWSATHQPTLKKPKHYEVIFSEGRAEFRRSDQSIDTYTSIVVSPEDDIELRRTRITNRSRISREITITSYSEIVLSSHASDELHPAFNKLFVQTEIDQTNHAILCHRRPRSITEKSPWFLHLMTASGGTVEEISYETDRAKFIGRWKTTVNPVATNNSQALSGTEGSVLDPITAIRYRITLDPEESAVIDIVSGIGETRQKAVELIAKYQDRRLTDRVFDLAWTHSQVVLRQLNSSESDAQLYGRLAASIIYDHSGLRTDPSVILRNHRGQSGLWGYSISGDVPIVLLQIEDTANINLVRQMVQAHNYWRLKGLIVDLVIWNEDHAEYRQVLHDQIMGFLASGADSTLIDRPGGIFLRSTEQISAEDRVLFQTVARVIINDRRGTLAEQVNRVLIKKEIPQFLAGRSYQYETSEIIADPRSDLIFFNGFGGFTPDGKEYIITTAKDQITPAPWVNVLANPDFGTVISEGGQAYTWSGNAHEFRLTPWRNDPISDTGGEAFYIRDEELGCFWSPMPLPSRGITPYVSRHGFGYSIFEHTEKEITSQATVFVAIDASIKFTVIKITNNSNHSRNLSITGYAEWVLGDLRSKTGMHIVTETDPTCNAIFARNGYSMDFAGKVAFFDTDDSGRTFTGDRGEFIGRNRNLGNPLAMTKTKLSGKVGAALDSCAAIQICFSLSPGEEREIIFKLGVGKDFKEAVALIHRFRGSSAAHGALEQIWNYWNHTLDTMKIETPDPALNMLTNGWLIYQTIACRLWARSGFYQSGGAFGFRDQLQDTMAIVHVKPKLARDQIILCASHQFSEGDVQHWWHPPIGRGVRTQCSDDFLWLPLAVSRYITQTGDSDILEESVHFIKGRALNSGEESYYDMAVKSDEKSTIYDHCIRAILKGKNYGEHGLPKIGSGDWNDGMNMVGEKGLGESIWLGFFYYEVLTKFETLAQNKNDQKFAEFCQSESTLLKQKIEQNGWDGEWYRRAYFDDGKPIGSASSQECQIDSISQSWSVLSGAGETNHCKLAMEAVDKRLVKKDYGLIQLLDPPFDKSDVNPGYIKGYVPGVRENGGQYTHAAIWTAMAFAKLGDSQKAWELTKMINPINHALSAQAVSVYKVEPFVMAADVYAVSPHIGRGGWTWYSGSAGWMYRLVIESLLGIIVEADKMYFKPCIPAEWEGFKVNYRYKETNYQIKIVQSGKSQGIQITLDGEYLSDGFVALVNDNIEHNVEVICKR